MRQNYSSSHEIERGHAFAEVPAGETAKPTCPRCGWSNTRPSLSRTPLDDVLEFVFVRAFRCRSCGNRFRVFLRNDVADRI